MGYFLFGVYPPTSIHYFTTEPLAPGVCPQPAVISTQQFQGAPGPASQYHSASQHKAHQLELHGSDPYLEGKTLLKNIRDPTRPSIQEQSQLPSTVTGQSHRQISSIRQMSNYAYVVLAAHTHTLCAVSEYFSYITTL